MIEIDGSTGEGGGQMLRTSLTLSMCTGRPFAMVRIRAGRPRPGLMRQHLGCVKAAAEISGAQVQGGELNSQSLRFAPGVLRAGEYRYQLGTAGSCSLLLQTVWPALMLAEAPSSLTLGGGTHNPHAPPFHFLERAYAPLMRRLGARSELTLRRLGFYPAGGGEIHAALWPAGAELDPFDLLERGRMEDRYAECYAPALPRSVAARELDELGKALDWDGVALRMPAARQNEGPGNALLATLAYEHVCEVYTRFGAKGISAEQVAQGLAADVRGHLESEGALGPHLADQWVLPLALAVWKRGREAAYTCSCLTPHARSNFEVIQRFLPVRISAAPQGRGWRVAVSPA